ncbi:MAG: alpha/beta hydrolase [Bacteroidetes bacterium]|nr:MAG: alpha/beta hydrolase [Bacteroidota bacterium]
MNYNIKQESKFSYIDEGEGKTLLLLHGLFGALSNWSDVLTHYAKNYRVVIPLLPIHDMPLRTAGLGAITDFIEDFVKLKQLTNVTILGNSLGGHLALIYTQRNPKNVERLVLTGSSGLFENSMGGSYPKRGSYGYIKERVEYTFFKPETATKELVDEVFEVTQSIQKCLRIVAIAKSAQRHNMANEITKITQPTLLVWGLNDTITPPTVGYEFLDLMPNAELHFIDHCSHAPMMEDAEEFNRILDEFLVSTNMN